MNNVKIVKTDNVDFYLMFPAGRALHIAEILTPGRAKTFCNRIVNIENADTLDILIIVKIEKSKICKNCSLIDERKGY